MIPPGQWIKNKERKKETRNFAAFIMKYFRTAKLEGSKVHLVCISSDLEPKKKRKVKSMF